MRAQLAGAFVALPRLLGPHWSTRAGPPPPLGEGCREALGSEGGTACHISPSYLPLGSLSCHRQGKCFVV